MASQAMPLRSMQGLLGQCPVEPHLQRKIRRPDLLWQPRRQPQFHSRSRAMTSKELLAII